MKLLAVSGSLKTASTNSALLRAASRLAGPATHFTLFDRQLGDLPHFSPDLDDEGARPPAAVAAWRRLLADATAVLVSCPEYAHGVPGSFKNALDWIVSSGELTDKPLALLMAGPGGAANAWPALRATLKVMGARLVFEASLVVARRHFDVDGKLIDEAIASQVRLALDALARADRNPLVR